MMYTNMKKQELVNLCKEKGLDTSGSAEELRKRLQEYDSKDSGIGVGVNSKDSFAVNAMREAIVNANLANNRHAITKDEAAEAGASEERFDQWRIWVEDLYEIVCEYVDCKRRRSSTEKERAASRQKIYPAWRSILKVGEEDLLSPKMYIREDDVESLIGFCEGFMATAKGTEQVNNTKMKFRRMVETLLGCRIKGCENLTADDRDLVMVYESAIRAKNKANTALYGNGKTQKGILADIMALEAAKEGLIKTLQGLGANAETIKGATATMVADLKKLKAAKKRSEDALKEAESTISANAEKAEVIYKRIESR